MSIPIERWLVEFDALNSPDIPALKETDKLWPIFIAVKKAAISAINSERQQIKTAKYVEGGSKIIEHTGNINGVFDEIELDITIEGKTINGQPECVEVAGELTAVYSKVGQTEILGTYTLNDGRAGAMCILVRDSKTYLEAYWLQSLRGFKLEQVKTDKKIFNVPDSENEQIAVPGTNILLTRAIY